MGYYRVKDGRLESLQTPPLAAKRLDQGASWLLLPLVSQLHHQFQTWAATGCSPGPVIPERVWINPQGELAFYFVHGRRPQPQMQVGLAPDLAAWLVLLDKWMDTFVVVARARTIWSVTQLGAALSFMSSAFLPKQLVVQPPTILRSV